MNTGTPHIRPAQMNAQAQDTNLASVPLRKKQLGAMGKSVKKTISIKFTMNRFHPTIGV